ncbi:MAG: ABC transporter permease [Firmicutes bacterium]|nr:ABC transporter permease [Bacillota bacterium]
MTYFTHSLKRLLRNKANVIFMLLLPSLLIGAIFGLADWGNNTITVGVVDQDVTLFTEMLVEDIAKSSPVVMLTEDEIRGTLANGSTHYIVVVDQGFTTALLANEALPLRGYSIQETNLSISSKLKMESYLQAAQSIAAQADGDDHLFYQKLEQYRAGSFSVRAQTVADDSRDTNTALGGIGLLTMSMLFLSTFATMNLLKDKEDRTYYRVMASPLSLKSYMLQSILSFLLVSLMQVTGVFIVILYIFKIYLGPSVLTLFILMSVVSLFSVSMGVALTGIARNTRQAGNVASLIIIPMSMLGGLFWPQNMMPAMLQKVGRLLPTSWVMEAAQKVILGGSLTSIRWEVLILLMYTLVFFLLGSWRKTDIAH